MSMLDNFPDEGYVANQPYEDSDSEYENEPEDILIPANKLGGGYFNVDVDKLKDGIDLQAKTDYRCVPRPEDQSPLTVPADHPLRAIASVLGDASHGSTIRVYGYVLTCKYAIDLLLHFAAQFDLRIILNYDDRTKVEAAAAAAAKGAPCKTYSVNRISSFLDSTEDSHSYALFGFAGCRVVDSRGHNWASNSSMQEKAIITTTKTVVGSYNFSFFARCKNYESVHVVDTVPEQISDFDTLWATLEGRDIVQVYPNSFSNKVSETRQVHSLSERKVG